MNIASAAIHGGRHVAREGSAAFWSALVASLGLQLNAKHDVSSYACAKWQSSCLEALWRIALRQFLCVLAEECAVAGRCRQTERCAIRTSAWATTCFGCICTGANAKCAPSGDFVARRYSETLLTSNSSHFSLAFASSSLGTRDGSSRLLKCNLPLMKWREIAVVHLPSSVHNCF